MSEIKRRTSGRDFGAASFFWRLGASLILVVATYNPTRFSYFQWVRNSWNASELGPEHFVAGVLVLIGWTVFLVATRRSLGLGGVFLGAALIGGIVWWLTSSNLIGVGSYAALAWVILICLSILLAVGLSWSHVWRRMTGQLEVDDNDG